MHHVSFKISSLCWLVFGWCVLCFTNKSWAGHSWWSSQSIASVAGAFHMLHTYVLFFPRDYFSTCLQVLFKTRFQDISSICCDRHWKTNLAHRVWERQNPIQLDITRQPPVPTVPANLSKMKTAESVADTREITTSGAISRWYNPKHMDLQVTLGVLDI